MSAGLLLLSSALEGPIEEVRSAGASPNRNVTPSVNASANANSRQSAGSINRAGLSAGLIRLTTNGADHHANNPPTADASRREHRAFHQNQLNQPPSPRADRHTQRHFARPRRALRGHQIRDVCARDQQDQRHQHGQRRSATTGNLFCTPEAPAAAGSIRRTSWPRRPGNHCWISASCRSLKSSAQPFANRPRRHARLQTHESSQRSSP